MSSPDIRPLDRRELSTLESAWPSHGVHEAHLRRQDSREATYLVAWDGAEPLGSAMVIWSPPMDEATAAAYPDLVEIAHLQVREEHQRRGVGTALVRAGEELARARGRGQAGLGVGLDNPDAARLYQRLGYGRTGIVTATSYTYRDRDGVERSATEQDELMVKRLAPADGGTARWPGSGIRGGRPGRRSGRSRRPGT